MTLGEPAAECEWVLQAALAADAPATIIMPLDKTAAAAIRTNERCSIVSSECWDFEKLLRRKKFSLLFVLQCAGPGCPSRHNENSPRPASAPHSLQLQTARLDNGRRDLITRRRDGSGRRVSGVR